MRRVIVRAGLVAALAAGACANTDNASWLAKSGDVVVERAEVEAYAFGESSEGLKGLKPEQKRALVERLAVRKSIAAEAERAGLGNDPSVQTSVMSWKFRHYPDMYWAETVEKEVKVTDEELRAMIDPRARYLVGAMVFQADDAGAREAKRVHGLLKAGGKFGELARKHSQGLSAAKDGDMGWVEIPNNMIEAKEAALIAATPVGGYTEPVLTQVGWAIYQVRDRVEAETVFQQAKAQMLPELRGRRLDEAKAQRRQELRKSATIIYPAEAPGARPGAPAAIVDGYVFPADVNMEAAPGHGNMQRVFKPRQQLDRSIDAFLLVKAGERLGFDERPDVKLRLAQVRMDALVYQMLHSKARPVAPTPEEVREDYRRYYQPEAYEIQMIVVDERKRAEEALRRSRAGEDFDALAKEINSAPLAAASGLLPLAPTATYPAAVQAVLPKLADGGVSDVLDLTGGKWGLVRRRAKLTMTPPPLEQVEPAIRKRIELRKMADQTTAFMQEYTGRVKVKLNEKLIAQL